jgi:hypothetical protein
MGMQTYRTQEVSGSVIILGTPKLDRITNGYDVQFLADYYLTSLESIDLHTEAGLGFVAFSGVLHDIPFSTEIDPIVSVKLISSVHLGADTTVDPAIAILKGFSSNDIFLVSVELGFSYWW